MVEGLARFLVRRPVAWAVVLGTLLVAALCGALSAEVEQDDDVLAFLPKSNPDIRAFQDINERFGGTDVALVGVEGDVFSADFLHRLEKATTTLRDTPGLDAALTLSNVTDFVEDPVTGGIITDTLVSDVPEDAAGLAALRDKVMSRDHIVGTLVSEDGGAIVVYGFSTPDAPPREVAGLMREAVVGAFDGADVRIFWGGGPFISTWIYETTQADMAALVPFAVVAILVIMMVAFRDVVGTALGLFATVVGIVATRAAMAVLGVSFNIVLSSMPVILFAIGSAYGIHVLSHYRHHAHDVGPGPEAVVRTLVGTGPTVFAAGMTTVVGLMSFVMMDIAPMRTFGLFTGLGIFVALIVSLTFIPAVLSLLRRPVRADTGAALLPWMESLVSAARRHRSPVLIAVGLLATVGASFAGLVDTRMDLAAFFDDGSPPAEAQAFLDDRFGGSTFLQLHVRGDLERPEVLREVGRIADRMGAIDGVTGVTAVDGVLGIVGDAMTGMRRVPDTPAQVGVLYRFLASDPAASRLITDDRAEALVQVRIGSTAADVVDGVLADVEALVAEEAVTAYAVVPAEDEAARDRLREVVGTRVIALARQFDVPADDAARARLAEVLGAPRPDARPEHVAEALDAFLVSEENFVPVAPEAASRVAASVAALGPDADWSAREPAVAEALALEPTDATVQDLLVALDGPIADAWRDARARAGAEAVVAALGAVPDDADVAERFRGRVASALVDLGAPTAMVPTADAGEGGEIAWTVSGMPVLYRGLSRSVTANQFKSLGFALALVLLIMSLLFRSIPSGLLATAPTALTLVLVYGGMGALGVHLDIGTSMLASIIIGAGVDYAVHYLSAWQALPGEDLGAAARRAAHDTSHAIWTNAIMVAAGFFVLTLGDARPLQNVGGLTATAMIVAALSTFVVLPMFARRASYGR